jgi:type I restriction enzyme M protein
MLSSAKDDGGRVGVVLSSGALSRKIESNIREKLLEQNDWLTAIIQLGPNLFYGTPIAPCILYFKKSKTNEEKKNVLMINAYNIYESGRAQNFLREEHVKEIMRLYKNRIEQKFTSRIVPLSEIKENDYNLSVFRYIESQLPEKLLPHSNSLNQFESKLESFKKSEDKLKTLLRELNLVG